MEKFIDSLYDFIVFYLIFFILALFLTKCSTTQKADTVKYASEVDSVLSDIDTSIECKDANCKSTVAKVKTLLEQSKELLTSKDEEIQEVQAENKELEGKAKSWDKLILSLWTIAIGLLIAIVAYLGWRYKSLILGLL